MESEKTSKGAKGEVATIVRWQFTAERHSGTHVGSVITGFKVNLVKAVKKDKNGIRKDIKKCKRRSRNYRSEQFIAERHAKTHVGSAEG
ncbi:hypothetical protein LR48_Vigan375s000800 [Vigna angularis]|uniref:Uncharacterized protein n=1 Tax=Phaseolus angularis TaxID=3914 RepID=A0A0L9T8Y8_PHAAN|nr:hypothetical protein LR48_Vigan375s000800 [Vigna angularis]